MLIKLTDTVTRARRGVNITAITFAAMAPLAFAIPAQAAPGPGDRVDVIINASDLNNNQGISNVYDTFVVQAERACDNNGMTLSDRRFERACIEDLVDDFVFDLDDPNVTALHYNGEVIVE